MTKKTKRPCKFCKGELQTINAWTERIEKIIDHSSCTAPGSDITIHQALAKVYKKECKQCRDITIEIEEWENK